MKDGEIFDASSVVRLEIIDHTPCTVCKGERWIHPEGEKPYECKECNGMGSKGREVVFWDAHKIINLVSLQDSGKTLKLFIDARPATAEEGPTGPVDPQPEVDE